MGKTYAFAWHTVAGTSSNFGLNFDGCIQVDGIPLMRHLRSLMFNQWNTSGKHGR